MRRRRSEPERSMTSLGRSYSSSRVRIEPGSLAPCWHVATCLGWNRVRSTELANSCYFQCCNPSFPLKSEPGKQAEPPTSLRVDVSGNSTQACQHVSEENSFSVVPTLRDACSDVLAYGCCTTEASLALIFRDFQLRSSLEAFLEGFRCEP